MGSGELEAGSWKRGAGSGELEVGRWRLNHESFGGEKVADRSQELCFMTKTD